MDPADPFRRLLALQHASAQATTPAGLARAELLRFRERTDQLAEKVLRWALWFRKGERGEAPACPPLLLRRAEREARRDLGVELLLARRDRALRCGHLRTAEVLEEMADLVRERIVH